MDGGIAFAGVNTRAEGVKVTGKIGMAGIHPMVEHFKFVQANTKRTPKITIPAPSAIYGRPAKTPIDPAVYPNIDQMFADLGQAYRKVVRQFADAGCRYLQLDEVFIAMLCDPKYREQMTARGDDPEKLGVIYGDLINAAMSDIPSDMTITMHLCRGNYQIHLSWVPAATTPCRKSCSTRSTCTAISWNTTTSAPAGSSRCACCRKARSVVLGIVTTKSGKLESKDDLKRRIDQAAKFVDLDQLCLSGQCGFASTEEGNTLTEDEQWAKLRLIVEVADEVLGVETSAEPVLLHHGWDKPGHDELELSACPIIPPTISPTSATPSARCARNFPANTGARSTASAPIQPNLSPR